MLDERTPLSGTTAAAEPVDVRKCCGTPQLRALWAAAILFSILALGQIAAAMLANLLELQIDGFWMLVDASTYALNIVAEYRKQQWAWRVGAVVWSMVALAGLTLFALCTAIGSLSSDAAIEEERINPTAFAFFLPIGLLVDAVSIAYLFCGENEACTGVLSGACLGLASPAPEAAAKKSADAPAAVPPRQAMDLNVKSAAAHVLLDLLRTLIQVISAIGMMVSGDQSVEGTIDDIGALVMCGFAVAALWLLGDELVREVREGWGTSKPEQPATGDARGKP